MIVYHSAHSRIEGYPTQVPKPRHTHAFKATVKRMREAFSSFIYGERRVGIWPRYRAKHEGKVGYRTSQASLGAQRRPCERRSRIGHAADGRSKANHVAECSRVA